MSHGGFYIPRLLKYLPQDLDGKKILDAGSGRGEVGYYIQAFVDRPACDLHGHPTIIGVDIHKPSVDFIREYLHPQIYEEIYYLDLTGEKTPGPEKFFKGRHFDIALLLEVPEHIEKNKMLKVLGEIEELADYILIATPLGDELNQDFGDKIPEFNHVSVWFPEDFKQRGYTVSVEEVTPRVGSRFVNLIIKMYRLLLGLKPPQMKIIAIRNKNKVKISKGLKFGGLCG